VVNGRSGRVLIFKLDDGSESHRGGGQRRRAGLPQRELLKEDELVVMQGKLQPDRFAGGLRLNVQQVWDLAAARARFGRYLAVDVNGTCRRWPTGPHLAGHARSRPSRAN
jgi:DNA polymerase-3 subunit alpha